MTTRKVKLLTEKEQLSITEFCEKRLCVLSDSHHEQVNAMRCRMKKLQEENARLSGLVERAGFLLEDNDHFDDTRIEEWNRDAREGDNPAIDLLNELRRDVMRGEGEG